jgi:hypothetical protein
VKTRAEGVHLRRPAGIEIKPEIDNIDLGFEPFIREKM